jgi:hypothetical protein
VSRGIGARQMKGIDEEFGGLAQRAQQGGLAQMRMERGDKDREFGLRQGADQRLAASQTASADLANTQAMAREADAARDAQHQAASLTETGRHNRAMERNALVRPPQFQVVVGEGGAQFWADPRNPQAPVRPVMGPDGQPVVKPRATRPIPPSEKNTLQEMTGEARALGALGQRFQPEFAGGGPLGGVATGVYQALGSMGTKGMQEDAAFWSDFQRLVDLPQRNAIFGASLTANEKSSWERAKNVSPKSDPDLVKKTLAEMQAISQRKVSEHGDALLAENFNPDAVRSLTGGLAGGQPTQGAGTVRVRRKSDGKTGAMPAQNFNPELYEEIE